ncbi:MAG: hypothetical protein QOF77_195 [Solirubrobacteraceae bacterium]|jgi:hypothetical protein|nr:hypothetical protein [Solirubrobacteraceae bacterium]
MTAEEIRRLLAGLEGITGEDWLIRGDDLANANCKAVRRDEVPEAARQEVEAWLAAHRGRLVSHREALVAAGGGRGRLRVLYEVPLKALWPPPSD